MQNEAFGLIYTTMMPQGIHPEIISIMLMFLVAMVSVTSSDICNRQAEDVLYTTGQTCLVTNTLRFPDMFVLSSWEKLCSVTNATKNCLRQQFQSCSTQHIQEVILAAMTQLYNYMNTWVPSVDSLIQIINRRCRGSNVRDTIIYAYQQAKHLDCINDKTRSDVTHCVKVLLDETADFRLSGNTSYVTSPDRRQSIIRFAMSTFQCVRNLVRANCSHWAQDILLDLVNITIPLQIRGTFSKDKVNVPLTKTSILSTKRNTVGAYGGIHLVIHGLTTPITCSLSGHVIYLSNQLFMINGHNQQAERGRNYINKLEIEFFRTGGGVIGTYQTNGNMLAKTFLYGDNELSPYYNPIQIMTTDSQSKIHINSSSLGYIITIHKQHKGYLFSVRISDEVLMTSSGILISGCSYSKGHIVDVTPEESLEDDNACHDTCQDVQITDEDLVLDLRKSCLFDCINNADTDSSKAFLDDVTDARDYDSVLELLDPPTTPGQSSSAESLYFLGPGSVAVVIIILHQVGLH